jgi:hypothetical protein
MQACRAFGLPCPWVPLQSLTAATSRRFPERQEVAAYLRGKAADALEPFCCDTGYGAQARGHANRAFEAEWGKPQPTAKPVCSEPGYARASCVGRNRGRTRSAGTGDVVLSRTLAETAD